MLSILIILLVSISLFCLGRKHKNNWLIKCALIVLINLLLLEIFLYGYFLFQIFKGTCFFLIGNQNTLDALIKTRLVHSVYFAQGKKNFINQVDNSLGYTVGFNKISGNYKTNQQGFRANREYSLIPPPSVLRLITLGDSFVFCDGETNDNTWQTIMESSARNLEVLNFGVPGYGLGQSYLRYLQDVLQFNPDIVLFNYTLLTSRDQVSPLEFVSANDLRMAHFYRARFKVENNILLSQGTTPYDLFDPVFRKEYLFSPLGFDEQHDFLSNKFFSISNTGLFVKELIFKRHFQDNFKEPEYDDENINLRILENILAVVKKHGSTAIFLHDRDFDQLPSRIQQLFKEYDSYVLYSNIQSLLNEQYMAHKDEKIECKKLSTPQNICSPPNLINSSGHFNAQGNQLYGEVILNILKSRNWGQGERKFRFDVKLSTFVNW